MPDPETPNSETPPTSTPPADPPSLIAGEPATTEPGTPPTEPAPKTPEEVAAEEGAAARATEMATPVTAEALVLPEGMTTTDELKGEFVETINKLGEMSPAERATALLELQSKALTAASEASSAEWDKMQDQWRTEVKTHYGDKLQPALDGINRLVTEHGDKELIQALAVTGAGNNLAVVKFFDKLATMLTEGGYAAGHSAGTEKSAAQRLYPSMNN